MDIKICAHNKKGIRVLTSDDHDHASYVSTTDVADTLQASVRPEWKPRPLIDSNKFGDQCCK